MIKKLVCGLIILYLFISVTPLLMTGATDTAIANNDDFTQTFVFKKSDIQKIDRLMSQYGKPAFIALIRSHNNGRITTQVDNELLEHLGYPHENHITHNSILLDLSELGWTFKKAEELILAEIIKEKKIDENRVRKIEELISKYGKSVIATSIRSRQRGEVTIQVGNELQKCLITPSENYITLYSILFDFNKLELTIEKAEELILQTIEDEKQAIAIRKEWERRKQESEEQKRQSFVKKPNIDIDNKRSGSFKELTEKVKLQKSPSQEAEDRDYQDWLHSRGKYERKTIKQPFSITKWYNNKFKQNKNIKWGFVAGILIISLLYLTYRNRVLNNDDQTLKNEHDELQTEEFNSEAGTDAESEIKDIPSFLNMGTNAKQELQNQIKKDSKKQKTMVQKIIYTGLIIFFGTIIFGIIGELVGRGQYLFSGLIVYSLFRVWQNSPSKKNKTEVLN